MLAVAFIAGVVVGAVCMAAFEFDLVRQQFMRRGE